MMNFKSNPTKYLSEYLEYFILKLENSSIPNRNIHLKTLNEYKTFDKNNNLEIYKIMESLRLYYLNIKEIKFVEYNRFYRCKELDMPIDF